MPRLGPGSIGPGEALDQLTVERCPTATRVSSDGDRTMSPGSPFLPGERKEPRIMSNVVHIPTGPALAGDIEGTTTRARLMDEARLIDSVARFDHGDPREPTGTHVCIDVTETRSHVDIHRCRRVLVTVNLGDWHLERRFIPSATIQAVRRWAVGMHGFNLAADKEPAYEVGVCGKGVMADRNVRVGMLATRCRLCLDLAPRDHFTG
jgi:hypothetical protein